MTPSVTLLAAIRLTYEVVGQPMSDLMLASLASELAAYDEAAVRAALARCRRELRRITLADILDRLPGAHPGPDEAWALVAPALADERVTVVWTDAMAEAAGVARALAADPIAARKAFQEAYAVAVGRARAQGQGLPRWWVSLGTDRAGAEPVIREAVHAGRLSAQAARHYVPLLGEAAPGPALDAAAQVVRQLQADAPLS